MSTFLWLLFDSLIVYFLLFLVFIFFRSRSENYNEAEDIEKKLNILMIFDCLTEYAFIQSLIKSKELKIMVFLAFLFVIAFICLIAFYA